MRRNLKYSRDSSQIQIRDIFRLSILERGQNMRKIEGLPIGDGYPCFIIAEIGQNHQGDVKIAKDLILKAKECGADCVKLQKSSLSHKFTQTALDSQYLSEHSFGETYGEHKRRLELSQDDYRECQAFAEGLGILFSASAMDHVSADFLVSLDVPFLKIGSGDSNNFPLLVHVAKSGKPVILSTGMQEFETVRKGVEIISRHHSNRLVLLHCVSAYPTPFQDVNLSLIEKYRNEFPTIPIGYSGHELGIAVSIGAVALGAKVIERHFTLDKGQKGTDHKCSLDPIEFKEMVQGIRQVEAAIGVPNKVILQSEHSCQEKLGKSLVASHNLVPGTILIAEDIDIKVSRPKGIKPEKLYNIIGKLVITNIEADAPIKLHDLKP